MGMYDIFIVDPSRLPISEQDKNNLKTDFQTKDFDNMLHTYEVENDKLFVTERGLQPNSKPKAVDFTGVIVFYNYNLYGDWLEFTANFVDGRLLQVNLELLERVEQQI